MDMKVVDDKLKIIDEVPSSAVEMSVKEKVKITWILQDSGFRLSYTVRYSLLYLILDRKSDERIISVLDPGASPQHFPTQLPRPKKQK